MPLFFSARGEGLIVPGPSPMGFPELEESWKPRKWFRGGRQREWQSVALLIRDSVLRQARASLRTVWLGSHERRLGSAFGVHHKRTVLRHWLSDRATP